MAPTTSQKGYNVQFITSHCFILWKHLFQLLTIRGRSVLLKPYLSIKTWNENNLYIVADNDQRTTEPATSLPQKWHRLELEAPSEVDVLLKLLRQRQLLDASLHENGQAHAAGGVGGRAAAPVTLGVAVAGVVARLVVARRRRVVAHLAVAALLPAATCRTTRGLKARHLFGSYYTGCKLETTQPGQLP